MQLNSCPLSRNFTPLETGAASTSKPAAAIPNSVAPVRRSQRSKLRQSTQTQAYDHDLVGSVSSLVSTGLVAAIGFQLLNQPEVSGSSRGQQGDKMEGRQSCMRCNGAGYEPCFCTKWSDGDVGCSACARSGYMRCRSCGGGGTMIPAYQPIKVQSKKN
ncbi:hypothetical protein DUNSADRAFT_17153 [Dunaliella salina]|uniref:Uncharacterized protein n=1 Tax=Dunaliella salina TaxID=3046 RepID=A0ABQ7H0D1_DUNSA|nr:hypothetical protein DUNSADRAFT_17153 [Dunaliella salina]|eukprot:KAF5840309.1 hypothetical protein DUNSADRAFT_17153 [Dunaliella salina]